MAPASSIAAVTMPKWGIEMTEGTITAWNVAVGQAVTKGEGLLEVETEKIINAVDAPASGLLRRIVAPSGETRPVGALIAVLAPAEVGEDEIDRFIASFKGATVSFEPESGAAAPVATVAAAASGADADAEARISPIARRLAAELGVDISKVKGTGRNGRISKEDIKAHVAAGSTAGVAANSGSGAAGTPALDNAPRRARLAGMRATIARRLAESKQTIPHYRLSVDVLVDALLARKAAMAAAGSARITVNDLLLRATALALIEHPRVNAQLVGDEVLEFPHADIAIAVATPQGLLTPIVRSADTRTLAELARATADLAARAASGALTRGEIAGGTFTVSNLGMHGIARFDAIINPPQVAILAVGAAQQRPVVRDGQLAVASVLTLTLSADHRVVDGAVAARFLATLQSLIEAPQQL